VKTLVVCSGGLDSVTLAHKIAAEESLTHLVSFDYGQRHKKELEYARGVARRGSGPRTRLSTSPTSAAGSPDRH
jgi:7-cyano-7-deazaguanine synthase